MPICVRLPTGAANEAELGIFDVDDRGTVVDWSKTRAYGMGFNGLYLNLAGRERDDPRTAGTVEAGSVQPGPAAGGSPR